jgi:hypothetical protein
VRAHARAEEREALVARRPEDDSDSDGDADTDADGSWVGVGHFDDSDVDADSDLGGRRQARGDTVPLERDSLKWPVDVEGEGWRPL